MALVFLTSGTSWTVPADCTSINWVDCIGAGGDGQLVSLTVQGGGGGAYARKNTISVAPGASIAYQVGTGVDTVFGGTNLASCICGAQAASGRTAGTAAASVGDVKYSGGTGHAVYGGGGGAGGPNGAGQNASGYPGGDGDAGSGGAGGAKGVAGGAGTEYDASHGSGGGAGGNNVGGAGIPGGLYGGGGGARASGTVGPGAQGLIVVSYTPVLIANMSVTEVADTASASASMKDVASLAVTEGADGFSGAAVLANSTATAGTSIAPFRSADYLDLITSEHRGKPKFTATVSASVSPAAEQQAVLDGLSEAFDLDTAIGVQLDAVGAWVGISRETQIPLVNVWFSFDIGGRGFDEGIWQGPYDPETGIYALDDDTYRKLIRLKILVNNWDGLEGSAAQAIETFYASEGSYPFLVGGQNMSMTVCISGARPPSVMFALFAGRYVEFKPASVQIDTVVPSIPGDAVFGFDVDNEYICGFDTASWAVNAEDAMIEELSA